MAEAINTGGIRPVTLPNRFPPMPAVARILSRFDREQLAGFIAVAIDIADAMDGDPDTEDDDHDEVQGDEKDSAWIEWDRMAPSLRGIRRHCGGYNEDDENDDPKEDDNQDKAVDDDGCDDVWDDREIEQMANDVPMLPAYSLDFDLLTDKRVFLGITNLTASFRTNGGSEMSADTGKTLKSVGVERAPGTPV